MAFYQALGKGPEAIFPGTVRRSPNVATGVEAGRLQFQNYSNGRRRPGLGELVPPRVLALSDLLNQGKNAMNGMVKKTELQYIALDWIKQLPRGSFFGPPDIYRFLEHYYKAQIEYRGDAGKEPRYKNDARQGIRIAHDQGLIEQVRQGSWRRV
jgi:hypothetical protein